MRRKIVEQLARTQRVEQIVGTICKGDAAAADSLGDLSQMVYTVLLTYDAGKVVDLWEKGQMDYFLARIVLNQSRSRRSPYYRALRGFRARAVPLTEKNGGVDDGT